MNLAATTPWVSASRMRNSSIVLYELDGLGHLPQIEDFDQFKAIFTEALP